MEKMRNHGIDICRILACLAVLLAHTVMLFWEFDPSSPPWVVYNTLALVSRCCVPLFFMISGALILSREKLVLRKHIKRTGHFLLLFFCWSFICAVIDNSFIHVWYRDASIVELVFGSYYHLWYLPAMLLCYLFIPLIHGFIYGEKLPVSYIMAVVLGFALLINIRALSGLPQWLKLLLDKFTTENVVYLIYILLGWFLWKHRLNWKQLALLGVAAFAAVILYSWLNLRYSINAGEPTTRFYSNMSTAMLLLSSFIFACCLNLEKLPVGFAKAVEELSACTLGIYFVHPLFISVLKSLHLDFTQFNIFVFFPACYIGFLLLSLLTSFILRRIPGIKKLVS